MVRREDVTTLQVKITTRAELDKIGNIHKETYDDIIQRLIKEHKERNHKK
ncbi:MAG: hypothetical protein M3P08_07715 [Thermoproteota archaeon]|nr:hypothetical protein [Thermoproteota archaeon]